MYCRFIIRSAPTGKWWLLDRDAKVGEFASFVEAHEGMMRVISPEEHRYDEFGVLYKEGI